MTVEEISCPECGSIMKSATTDHLIDVLDTTIHNVPCLKCSRCCNELYTSDHVELIQEKMKKLGIFGWGSLIGKEIEMTVTESGRRLVIGIPKEVERTFGLKPGVKAKIKVKGIDDLEVTFGAT